jgi:hypothetical protein
MVASNTTYSVSLNADGRPDFGRSRILPADRHSTHGWLQSGWAAGFVGIGSLYREACYPACSMV